MPRAAWDDKESRGTGARADHARSPHPSPGYNPLVDPRPWRMMTEQGGRCNLRGSLIHPVFIGLAALGIHGAGSAKGIRPDALRAAYEPDPNSPRPCPAARIAPDANR
jgi:hypothetical protein